MEWKYVKPLETEKFIKEFEEKEKYNFCEAFIKCVQLNNGGRPTKSLFNTNKTKERAIKKILSFNRDDVENIWDINDWNSKELNGKYIVFGIDNFGNLICFDKNNGTVIFFSCEDLSTEFIATDFESFVNMLY